MEDTFKGTFINQHRVYIQQYTPQKILLKNYTKNVNFYYFVIYMDIVDHIMLLFMVVDV